jgi:hypothetical protein
MSMDTARKLVEKGAKLLDDSSCGVKECKRGHEDRPVFGNWRHLIREKGNKLDMNDPKHCVLGVLFDDYFAGIDALGSIRGATYGFADGLDVSCSDLKSAWLEVVDFANKDAGVFAVGSFLKGRWGAKCRLRIESLVPFGDKMFYLTTNGIKTENGYEANGLDPVLQSANDLAADWEAIPDFIAEEGDLLASASRDKLWYVGTANKAWELKAGSPVLWVGLNSLIAETPDIKHVKRSNGVNLVDGA